MPVNAKNNYISDNQSLLKQVSGNTNITPHNSENTPNSGKNKKEQHKSAIDYEQIYDRLVEDMGDKFVFYNHLISGELTYVSKSVFVMFGISEKEVIGKLWQNSVNWLPGSIEVAEDIVFRMVKFGDSFFQHEMQFIHPEGPQKTIRVSSHSVLNTDNNVISIDGMVEDITEFKQAEQKLHESHKQTEEALELLTEANLQLQSEVYHRKEAERTLSYIAMHDELTQLPNRKLVLESAQKMLALANRKQELVGCMFIDIDHFKDINDNYGHAAGDAVLVELSLRLRDSIRDCDILGRFSGDEFIIFLPACNSIVEIEDIASRILAESQNPMEAPKNKVVNLSIGIAVFPECGSTTDSLISLADKAMYQAKKAGGNRFYSQYHLVTSS